MDVRLKRASEAASRVDGSSVLVDRLWPRGASKRRARLDEWSVEGMKAACSLGDRST
jgi:uncharacterized protein YeaO (DUF488 family)